MNNKSAFTLAEVLITIGIIGVVASMTIPTLMKDIEKKDLVTANKKARAVLLAGLKTAAYDNGGTLNGYNLGVNAGEYFRLAKNCNTATTDRYSCWHATGVAKRLQQDGTYANLDSATTGSVVTMDGMFLKFSNSNLDCSKPQTTNSCHIIDFTGGYCGTYYIDINGARKPNLYGEDIREIQLWADGYVKFPGDSSVGRARWTATRIKDDSEYEAGGSCYDPNNYSADTLSE